MAASTDDLNMVSVTVALRVRAHTHLEDIASITSPSGLTIECPAC